MPQSTSPSSTARHSPDIKAKEYLIGPDFLQSKADTTTPATTPSSPDTLPPLLRLPGEIRLEIYNHILAASPIIYAEHSSTTLPPSTAVLPAAPTTRDSSQTAYGILFTNKYLCREFLDYTYSAHPITFVVLSDAIKDFSHWKVGPLTLARAKNVRFRLDMNVKNWDGERDRMERELYMPGVVSCLPALHRMQAEVVLKTGWTDEESGVGRGWGNEESSVGWWGEDEGSGEYQRVGEPKSVVSEIEWKEMCVEGEGQWTYVIS